MNDYKLTVDIEPTDKYEKAKQDLLQAKKSIEALSPEERKRLVCETFSAETLQTFLRFINMQKNGGVR